MFRSSCVSQLPYDPAISKREIARRLFARSPMPTAQQRRIFGPELASILGLALACALAFALPCLGAQGLPAAEGDSFFALISNGSGANEACLAFGDNGQGTHPQRQSWGSGPYCGFPGGKNQLIGNGQALWKLISLGEGKYLIINSARGPQECLIFSGNGQDRFPQRYNWGPGAYCGFPGGKEALLDNGQAVWTLTQLTGDRYMITNASAGSEQCLIFGQQGQALHPERYRWAASGDFCGFPGGKEPFLNNGQGVFTIRRQTLDDFVLPTAWREGYLILQNVMHAHQRLHVGHDGDGQLYADWGSDRAYRWQAEPSGDGHFFFLRNALLGQRLHVGHDGNGRLYAAFGDDDAYRWTAEPVGEHYLLRNKMYPGQRLHVGHDGNGQLYAEWGEDTAYQWQVQLLPGVDAAADNHFQLSEHYLVNDLLIENAGHANQRLHVGHDGNGQLYAEQGDDTAYQWFAQPWFNEGYYLLANLMHPQLLRVKQDGSGQLEAALGGGDNQQWSIDPVGWQQFFIANRQFPEQLLRVRDDGSGQPYAGAGHSPEARWRLKVLPVEPRLWQGGGQGCDSFPDWYRHGAVEVCFSPYERSMGSDFCRVHRDQDGTVHQVDLPPSVALNAGSVRVASCRPGTPEHRIFVYDQRGQRSDTVVVQGHGHLGAVSRRAWSYQVESHAQSQDTPFLCLHTEVGGLGRQHCTPHLDGEPVINLALDFEDQVRSVLMYPNWSCSGAELKQHFDGEGDGLLFAHDIGDLSQETIGNGPLAGQTWAEVVSSFRLKDACPD